MKFKYSDKIAALGITDCPPLNCNQPLDNTLFYRWIHSDDNHKNNFLPVLEINPKRIETPKFKNNNQKCSGFALSMHDSLANSEKNYLFLSNHVPNFSEIVGDFIAEIRLQTIDGWQTPTDNYGHLDFFENEDVDWKSKILRTIKIEE